ncbi:MAG TPA: hypothetical protein VL978_17060 [Puia sp.]|nr:hypothetical protein [Puia sp.]
MCLSSIGVDTLGLLLRVWLWISVPTAVIILLVATWMNYVRNIRPKGSLKLAVEGVGGGVSSDGGDLFVGRDEVVGEGVAPETGGTFTEGEGGEGGDGVGREDREELTGTGKEAIYQGILWMKDKYEQYREQADRKYELLREELGRSERRYEELLATMDRSEGKEVVRVDRSERREAVPVDRSEGKEPAGMDRSEGRELAEAGLGNELAQVRGQLDAKQGIIDDLESQLRSERMKVEELVLKLQANSELILRIYRELESIPNLGK